MPWTKNDPPESMKNLPAKIRNKAVSIANALYREGKEEGQVIAIAISQAKKWAKNESLINKLEKYTGKIVVLNSIKEAASMGLPPKVLKIEVEKSQYNPSWFGVCVKCEDGVNTRDVLEALRLYKNQAVIEKAFLNSAGVTVRLKVPGSPRYHGPQTITKGLYDKYKAFKEQADQTATTSDETGHKSAPIHENKKVMKESHEDYLNDLYSDSYSEEDAVDSLIYLTNKSRGKTVSEKGLRQAYHNRQLGTLLKKLDPVAFNTSKNDR